MSNENPSLPESPPSPLAPISLLLPQAGKYKDASMKALIFLAIESNSSMSTEAAIATEIATLTEGQRTPSQSCISKHLRPMKQRNIYARDDIWKIEKHEDHYCLVGQEDARRHEALTTLSLVPFDRSSVFQNSPFTPSVFGFKFDPSANITADQISTAINFFKALLDDQYFDIVEHNHVLYILLDSRNYHFSDTSKALIKFIDDDFLIKSSR